MCQLKKKREIDKDSHRQQSWQCKEQLWPQRAWTVWDYYAPYMLWDTRAANLVQRRARDGITVIANKASHTCVPYPLRHWLFRTEHTVSGAGPLQGRCSPLLAHNRGNGTTVMWRCHISQEVSYLQAHTLLKLLSKLFCFIKQNGF